MFARNQTLVASIKLFRRKQCLLKNQNQERIFIVIYTGGLKMNNLKVNWSGVKHTSANVNAAKNTLAQKIVGGLKKLAQKVKSLFTKKVKK